MRIRTTSVTPLLAILLGACRPSAQLEVASEPTTAPAEPAAERHVRVQGAMLLYADPSETAVFIALDPLDAGARVVEVLERREGWVRVRSVAPREALALGLAANEGLAVLELEGWIAAGQLLAADRGMTVGAGSLAAADQPSTPMPARLTIPAGTLLRWPDGRVAGRASEDHYFYGLASARVAETPEGPVELRCHARRAAPGLGVISGELCSAVADVNEAVIVGPRGTALDDPPRMVIVGSESGEPPPAPAAEGALDRDIIRRIVRAHLGEVRDCYNDGLLRDPTLSGRVSINFVIGPEGFVTSAVVGDDSLPDKSVSQCIAKAVATWQFPKPRGGGNVVVTYPFNLVPE